MKLKKVIVSALAGLSMMASLAGPAAAKTLEINIYGSSAQYLYWNADAPGILESAKFGCPAANIVQGDDNSAANGITIATGCTNPDGNDTIIIRSSSKASFDGPSALLGNDQYANWISTTAGEKCQAGDAGDPGSGTEVNGNGDAMPLRGYYRKMIDESSCSGLTATPTTHGQCTKLKCVRVTLGASDVAPASFTQTSHGQIWGPRNGGWVDRVFSGIYMSNTNYGSANPMVVPFAFFVNNSVQRCTGVDANGLPLEWGSTGCNPATITNMPRMMAVQLFSKQIKNWSDFGGDFTPAPAVVCLRHAGSGTMATLDYAVMNHNRWGGQLVTNESLGVGGYTVYFNDGSGDEMKCVDGAAWTTPDPTAAAVGYSDADQGVGPGSSYVNTSRVDYNGEVPSRVSIRNGRYGFFTNEWILWNKIAPEYPVVGSYIDSLLTYAANPANMPSVKGFWGAAKNFYWASSGEMNFNKNTDQKYPGYVGCDSADGYCSQP